MPSDHASDPGTHPQQRRALLAERLLRDLTRATTRDLAVGIVVQALTTVGGADTAELLLRPGGQPPPPDPAVVLARSEADGVVVVQIGEHVHVTKTLAPPVTDDETDTHRSIDRTHGLELVVRGAQVPVIAIDRALEALVAMIDRLDEQQQLLLAARTDVLTGLLNRRALDQRLETELARAVRSSAPLSLVMLDLDGFKQVNDTQGHAAGDELLRRVAEIIREVARTADDAARPGGDEFALLLPWTDADGAEVVARRLNEELLAHDAAASIGVATWPGAGTPPSVGELTRLADAAMYRAKRSPTAAIVHSSEVL